jgi:hypothetical protein
VRDRAGLYHQLISGTANSPTFETQHTKLESGSICSTHKYIYIESIFAVAPTKYNPYRWLNCIPLSLNSSTLSKGQDRPRQHRGVRAGESVMSIAFCVEKRPPEILLMGLCLSRRSWQPLCTWTKCRHAHWFRSAASPVSRMIRSWP